ncbi:MAG: hypothetical protein RR595_08100 [Lysinibacillus sp.]
MQIGIWLGILLSATIAFLVGKFFDQPLHWYLFVVIVIVGFFINTIIIILKAKEKKHDE